MKNLNNQMRLLIAGLALIAAGLIITMIYLINHNEGSFYIFNSKRPKLVNTETIPLNNAKNIEINYRYENIRIYNTSDKEITLNEYRNKGKNENEFAEISASEDTILIEGQGGDSKNLLHFFSFVAEGDYVELFIPDTYRGQLKSLTSSGDQTLADAMTLSNAILESSSGYIDTNDLTTNDIQLRTSSGDIDMKRISCDGSSVDTTSGYVDIDTVSGNSCTIRTSSGDIDVNNIIGDTELHTTSGYVDLGTVSGSTITIRTSSGDIEAKMAEGDIQLDTSSGYMTLSDSNGNIQFKSNSGDVSIHNRTGNVSGSTSSGYVELTSQNGLIDVTTNSGDIELSSAATSGSIRLNSESGYQELNLPADASISFDAVTDSGDIETFFDDTLMYNKDGDLAQGTVGKAPHLQVNLSTTSGDIDVSKIK